MLAFIYNSRGLLSSSRGIRYLHGVPGQVASLKASQRTTNGATLHPNELAAPHGALHQPSYAAPEPNELAYPFLSYAAHSELHCNLSAPSELR
jgi:hypothetical protein